MQNFNLLRELGDRRKPVLLKRGISATIEELLLSAEYILAGGNYDVILCERGIRTFESYTRNTMDISAIPVVKKLSHLPMIADPSHGTGRRDKVLPMARAAVAAGADGLIIEVHDDPDKALSDGAQSLFPEQFAELMEQLRIIAPAVGRSCKVELYNVRKRRDLRCGPHRRLLRAGAAKAGYTGRITGVSSPATIARAIELGVVDAGQPPARSRRRRRSDFSGAADQRDSRDHRRYRGSVRESALVTDAGSTKASIMSRGSGAHGWPDIYRAAIPWPARRLAVWKPLTPGCFAGRIWALTPSKPEDLQTPQYQRIRPVAGGIGAIPLVLDAAEHDRIVSLTSHLPQLVSTALAATLADRTLVLRGCTVRVLKT